MNYELMCLYRLFRKDVRGFPIGARKERKTTSGVDYQSQGVYQEQAQARAWGRLGTAPALQTHLASSIQSEQGVIAETSF